MNRVLHDAAYAREYYGVGLDERRGLARRARKLGARLGLIEPARGKFDLTEGERLHLVTSHLGLPRERILTLRHHLCHAAAAYYGASFTAQRARVLTNDNSGDGDCAHAYTGEGLDRAGRESAPSASGSLGSFYSFVTLLLGMKFGEHEYKVMGLAPYASAGATERAAQKLREVFELDAATPARFVWKRRGRRYQQLLEATLGLRFDAIAGGARRAGRMEFGARALGNRSILANPSDHRVVTLINRMIKNRDFWMPFAPSILRERESDYLVNPKGLASPYMMLAFPTNPKRRDEIVAAVHPHDGTARAHILDETWNPRYHRVIREFERRTGIGAVLNTSFNLHGEPLVGSPADAIDTFERSGLPHVALGRFLISKK